jgi:ribosome-binding protein aMBF1 (putative translation factor)
MEKYTLDITSQDIGEMIEMIRVQYLKIHAEPFAQKIGVKESLLLTVEEGKGPHGILLLKKVNDTFKNVRVKLVVEID